MALVLGLALRARLCAILALVLVAGTAHREAADVAGGEELPVRRRAHAVAADLAHLPAAARPRLLHTGKHTADQKIQSFLPQDPPPRRRTECSRDRSPVPLTTASASPSMARELGSPRTDEELGPGQQPEPAPAPTPEIRAGAGTDQHRISRCKRARAATSSGSGRGPGLTTRGRQREGRGENRAPHRWRKPRQRELVPLSLSTRGIKNRRGIIVTAGRF